jgi:ribosomal protein S18 acetylase RimI-like enzyme
MHVLYLGENQWRLPVAYGLVSYDHSLTPWLSGGVLSTCRGQGYGTELFKFLSSCWNTSVYLEVLESNQIAHKLYTGLGFQETNRERRVLLSKGAPFNAATVITMKKG